MAWPKTHLDDVLRLDLDRVSVDAATSYPMVGVLSFGRGLFEKEPIENGKTSYKYFNRLKAEHVVMSQLFGWEGALALSSEKYAGKYLSPQFPTFLCDSTRLDREFLGWLMRRPSFWEDLGSRASGMGDRRRTLNPDALFACEIPLPPLAEQRRIVVRIEALAAKITEARSLRQQAAEEADRLLICMAHRRDMDDAAKRHDGWRRIPLRECVHLVDDSRRVEADKSYPNLGIYSFGRGLFHKPPIDGVATSAKTLRRVKRGQFIYSRLFAFEGSYGMVSDEFDGHFVSGEYPTFDCIPGFARVEFLASYFKSSEVWKDIATGSKGLGDRRQRVQPKQVLDHVLWVPPMSWQDAIADEKKKVDVLGRLQSETAAELDAMLPAILDRAFKGELLSVEPVPVVLPTAAEAPPTKHSRGIYYRRAAIDAYIVNALRDDKNLGRTKLEKISHLLEYHCGVDLEREPLRDAAGPIDNVSRRKVESLAVKQRWYNVKEAREHWGMRVSYTPGLKVADALAYAKKTLGAHHSSVDDLIAMLRPLDTKQSEIIATLYAAWNDLLLAGKSPTDDEIVIEAREHWHPSKQEISVDRWVKGLRWLRHLGLIPRGTGKPVRHAGG